MKYFNEKEFACNCCGDINIDDNLTAKLDKARELADTPFRINSGYRCEVHNANVGGVKGSSHTKGYAADIAVNGSANRFTILCSLLDAGFNRVGVYKTFIHVDVDPDKPSNVIWYGK